MDYRPRADCSDVPLDSDDRWLDRSALEGRVAEIVRAQEHITAGFAEVPFEMSSSELTRRIEAIGPVLESLGRLRAGDDGPVFHWSVAELVAHRALADFWSAVLEWPLGSWPWNGDV